ncbi:hypothetical protein COCMIDRAFT_101065 [Bipolaris oryzae ATCC 44560]|uniref:Uncharacterized protein n=1 Tax=Bipolaris oryzae ATCC 44560 TaxID=930090 RepID=W6Z733_COCMI|nr:uncharacterized protein COCMIDRAFT_101065 [Bipolaris oryzae ATCC 44560]EUC43364.1 hypothetical protein COCMIDRAFT_101065 [Bipolaris oryzae ATCC 44560]
MYSEMQTGDKMKQDLKSKREKLSTAVDKTHYAAAEVTAPVKDEIAVKVKSILTNEIAKRTTEDTFDIRGKEADSQAAIENAGIQADLDRTVSARQVLRDTSSKEMQAMRTEHEVLRAKHNALWIKYETLCTDNEALRTRNEALLLEGKALHPRTESLPAENKALQPQNGMLQADNRALRFHTEAQFINN